MNKGIVYDLETVNTSFFKKEVANSANSAFSLRKIVEFFCLF